MDPNNPENNPANAQANGMQPAPQQSDDLSSRWSSWLDKPSNRAAMMQFGVAMLQPMMPGENVLSRFGSSVGAGGEAAGRVAEQDMKERALESKTELQGSQAQLAGERAAHQGDIAGFRELMARNAEDRVRMQQEQGGFGRKLSAVKEYEAAKLLNPDIEPFEEWAGKYGLDVGARPQASAPQKPPTAQIMKDPRWPELKARALKEPPFLRQLLDRVADPDALKAQLGVK